MSELSIEEVKLKLPKINEYINQCIIRINQGEYLDLASLNEQVSIICGSVNKIDNKEDKVLLSGLMKSLISNLDRLEDAIKTKQIAV